MNGGHCEEVVREKHLPYLTAALNSRYATDWWRSNATPHAGGYFGLTARAIALLPIPDPATQPAEVLSAIGPPADADDDPFGRVLGEHLEELEAMRGLTSAAH